MLLLQVRLFGAPVGSLGSQWVEVADVSSMLRAHLASPGSCEVGGWWWSGGRQRGDEGGEGEGVDSINEEDGIARKPWQSMGRQDKEKGARLGRSCTRLAEGLAWGGIASEVGKAGSVP